MEVKLKDDEKRFVLHRSDALMIQFNPRPYAGGHVLIYPTKHVASPHDLDCITWADMFLVADYVMEVLKIVLKVDSFSLGMNIGPNGNGTIPDHLHLHIVPRKSRGGFLETCCNTVLIQEDYGKLYKNMKEYFTKE